MISKQRRLIFYLALFLFSCQFSAQTAAEDTIKVIELEELTVSHTNQSRLNKANSISLKLVDKDFMLKNFTGNLLQTLQKIEGVQSMDIGSGYAKPVIRGMGFNRVSFVENGIKQEGQQWGADHGLEYDSFNSDLLLVKKGPASILYGSDAMGGVIEVVPQIAPFENQIFGEGSSFFKSVNETLGASLMFGIKKNAFFTRIRYSEQHFGDYKIPTDTVIYLTYPIPIYGRRLKNTAGFERAISLLSQYERKNYRLRLSLSNAYQKVGFFPGVHGIPNSKNSNVQKDKSSRNIDLPFSHVNHFKLSLHQYMRWGETSMVFDLGFQNNHREEWSLFHTHYENQPAPTEDKNKELLFDLNTYSANAKINFKEYGSLTHSASVNVQYQNNKIGGYSFLLPEYSRFTAGLAWLANYRYSDQVLLSGGARYDYGKIDIKPFHDQYMEKFLKDSHYSQDTIQFFSARSREVHRNLGDYSLALGVVLTPNSAHTFKANLGRSFRLPGANELASNGVHHGAFRHEQGDASLNSERGWQLDMNYTFANEKINFNISPFLNYFNNYIFLKPTTSFSIVPHSGQIYKYVESSVLFTGGELSCDIQLPRGFSYKFSGEYVLTYNINEQIPLNFSPPASIRNSLSWTKGSFRANAEYHFIAPQYRVARNEEITEGASLFELGLQHTARWGKQEIELSFTAHNIFNKKYFNHMSFYRKVEIPEPGRNFQLLIKIPFKKLTK